MNKWINKWIKANDSVIIKMKIRVIQWWMNNWMNERMNKRMNERINERMTERMNEWKNEWKKERWGCLNCELWIAKIQDYKTKTL